MRVSVKVEAVVAAIVDDIGAGIVAHWDGLHDLSLNHLSHDCSLVGILHGTDRVLDRHAK